MRSENRELPTYENQIVQCFTRRIALSFTVFVSLLLLPDVFRLSEASQGQGTVRNALSAPKIEDQLPQSGRFKLPSSWKNLKPLQATRDEVEHVLGAPTNSVGSRQIYENDTERVDVVYSIGRCQAVAGRWNVAPNVVIVVEIYPKTSLFLEDLIFNKWKYIRQVWSHPSDWVSYRNKVDGIEIQTVSHGKNAEELRQFSFGPKAKDKNLRCNN